MPNAIASFYRERCTPEKYKQIVALAQQMFGDRVQLPPSACIDFTIRDGTQEDAESFSAAVDAIYIGFQESNGN